MSELGSETNPNNANVAKVKFTVRSAGQYKISVMIGSTHIAGSPFVRNFLPGPIDANKSRLVRPANTVVCCAGAITLLHIEPRDEFANACTFTNDLDAIKDFRVEIYDLDDVIDAKLAEAITFSYDKVNARISVALLFPEAVCVRASIMFKQRKIPNGDFDLIVLSSSDTTLVHKNITRRNICYEAKLLSMCSETKKKPRKVLCYIGPKQITIKEKILKIIPKRIATFRLCPSTKVSFFE